MPEEHKRRGAVVRPPTQNIVKANRSNDLTHYLDLTFTVESNNRLYTKLNYKCDDLNLHIVDFPI